MAVLPGQGNTDTSGNFAFVRPSRQQVSVSMACATLAVFLGAMGQTIVATALPRIVAELGGFDRYTWVVTAYLVSATVAAPICGGLSDLYGRKPFFILGLTIFIVASFFLGVSGSIDEVIAVRAVQGVGGGLLMTCGIVTVADLFPPEERGKYQGLLAGVFGIAAIVGPVLGGMVTDHYSWNWVFLLNIPVAIPVLILIFLVFPNTRPARTGGNIDAAGMATLALAVTSLLLTLSIGGTRFAWSSPQCIGLLALALAMASVFICVEFRAEAPIMPMSLYANRAVVLAMVVVLFTGFGLYGSVIVVPLYLQSVLGLSPTASGNLLIPMLPGIVIGAIVSGQLHSRIGGHFRLYVLGGSALTAIGMILIATMSNETSVFMIEVYLVTTAVGLGTTLAIVTVAVQNAVPSRLVGAGTAANQFFRSVGGMIGLAVVGAVMTLGFRSRMESAVSDDLTASLPQMPQGLLESVKSNPQALLSAPAADTLQDRLAGAGTGGVRVAEPLLEAVYAALAGALSDAFLALVAAASLSLVATLLFFVGADGERPNRT